MEKNLNYKDIKHIVTVINSKEPLSYEFMNLFYVQGMDEVIQEIFEVVRDTDLGLLTLKMRQM